MSPDSYVATYRVSLPKRNIFVISANKLGKHITRKHRERATLQPALSNLLILAMLLSHSHSSMQVFVRLMVGVVSALAVAAGMDAHAPRRAHVHGVVGAHLLLYGHSIHRAQDLGRQPQVYMEMMGTTAVSKSEADF